MSLLKTLDCGALFRYICLYNICQTCPKELEEVNFSVWNFPINKNNYTMKVCFHSWLDYSTFPLLKFLRSIQKIFCFFLLYIVYTLYCGIKILTRYYLLTTNCKVVKLGFWVYHCSIFCWNTYTILNTCDYITTDSDIEKLALESRDNER